MVGFQINLKVEPTGFSDRLNGICVCEQRRGVKEPRMTPSWKDRAAVD